MPSASEDSAAGHQNPQASPVRTCNSGNSQHENTPTNGPGRVQHLEVPSPTLTSHRKSSRAKHVRPRQSLTPQQYIQSISAHSSRLLTTSSFPGNNYVDLANWLSQEAYTPTNLHHDSTHILVVLHELSSNASDPQCFTENDLEAFRLVQPPAQGRSQLLFVRGFLSPEWLSTIGSKYMLDPEFILRHLDFFAGSVQRHGYGLPSLASTNSNIMRLCTSTIVHRDERFRVNHPDKLIRCRREQREEMSGYKRQLRNQAKCGDSLVREFSTIDDKHSLVEQWMSLCVAKSAEGWLGVVWMDQGKDLAVSPRGPWISHLQANGFAFPVIQHHPKMTVRNTVNIAPISPNKDPLSSQSRLSISNREREYPQSGSLLPLEYQSLLALVDLGRRCAIDPKLALIPTFVHAAFSQVHLSNLIEAQISNEVDALAVGAPHGSIENLQYLSNILERHSNHSNDALKALSNLFEHQSDQGDGSRRLAEAMNTRIYPGLEIGAEGSLPVHTSGQGTYSSPGLKDDYRELLSRSVMLIDRCSMGIQTMMNKAMVLESHKAIEQAEDLKKLTLLASFFIPLSFVSSVFGMNFRIMGQGSLAIWWFFAVAVPITLLSQMWYIWDSQKFRAWRKKEVLGKRHSPR
ncbi:hypothetical protein HBI56_029420 [Parastagonospora nodorum]|uniref:Uncharacterized protein n=2 Tax=Phaeosphaeria nodorum (strain SN15 / ATCC MYA-4574 / FGSC 10173) TaxID=321614 RepID=A0A7U2F1U7_PHANO|nr:hypothetical protein HBH56_017030 [Parastagonospora nodorum]QRC95150.1 hypothetical protein JI435_028700 [Parastagonospora nodorum SN15]KAH3936932.1 hypothetical protein HBH54_017440 [Parastagonospora nodorum]KAH4059449.1 hypothetical protein HBH49_018250 [Parastagonospora nodorum]KAH4120969.1 hypothetical protein HBH47_107900 [Parastagonospora nodorum]